MNEEEFDQLSLPKDSANENLETQSRQKLAALFSIQLFDLKDELQHDKGVDLFVELKRNGKSTNFRFAIQLKATQAGKYNKDGSLSFALDVSNINYLMNYNMPAYYILYESGQDAFFYVEAFRVYEELTNKYAGRTYPKTYSYRFEQRLDTAAIKKLYNETFERGRLLRDVNPLLQMNLQQNHAGSSVVINEQQEAYTTAQRVCYLEKYGLQLLNAAQFKQVIELEQQCYPLPKVTGAFHYVSGMAYYHQAKMYKAIDHLKEADKMADDLHPEMVVMVGYYTAMAKFALGILSKDEIKNVINKYKHSTYVGLYLRVTEAYNQYIMGAANEPVKYEQFYEELELIKSAPASDANIRLLADAQAIQVEGQRLNSELMDELMLERALPFNAAGKGSNGFDDAVANYNNKINTLQNRAKLENNYLAYLIICLNSLKINYTSVAMAYCIRNFDEETLTSNYQLDPIALSWLEERIGFLEETAEFYLELGYLENMVVALSLKYEILHFIGDATAAQSVKDYLFGILYANDLVEYQRKFNHLINGETFHEVTLKMLVGNFEKIAAAKPEADRLQQEMDAFDAEDASRSKTEFADQMDIDIFPLGWFGFPGEALEAVMDALHVEGRAVREQFAWMLKDGVMAQVNALNDPVTSEGHGGGMRAHKGIGSLRNLYRVRKWLFEQGYCRIG